MTGKCEERELSDSMTGIDSDAAGYKGRPCLRPVEETRRAFKLCARCAVQFDLLSAMGAFEDIGSRN